MSKFVKNLSLFLSGLPLLLPRAGHATLQEDPAARGLDDPGAVPLRPLNRDIDNLFAGHSSHSSHASHASHSSHYSGSGGSASPGYASPQPVPQPPAESLLPPAPAPAPSAPYASSRYRAPSTMPGAAPSSAADTGLTKSEKLKLQLMRVQIRLHSLGLYDGRIDGVRNEQTIEALKHFQTVKGLPEDGMMTTPTLNALGIPAAN